MRQVTYSPVQSSIVKPARPASVIAPLDTKIHVVTSTTQGTKLEDNKVYMCYAWNDYISYAVFQRDVLTFIKQTNGVLDYYENTVDELNNKGEPDVERDTE